MSTDWTEFDREFAHEGTPEPSAWELTETALLAEAEAERTARPWRDGFPWGVERTGLDVVEAEVTALYSTRLGESPERAAERTHKLLTEAWTAHGFELESSRVARVRVALLAERDRLVKLGAIAPKPKPRPVPKLAPVSEARPARKGRQVVEIREPGSAK